MENGKQDAGTIILTGYFQSALEVIYEMLTSDIKISMESVVKAHISQAKEFDQYVDPTVTKCIIAATYTERMNLLIEGSDTGQVTDLFYKAGKMDILLICVGLPKRQFKQIKTTSYIYHQELSKLFSTQTLLGDLAKKERFISVLRSGKLDKEQISALNKFIYPSKGQQIQHDKQIIAGQGQTSHQQSVDEHGGEIARCHGDHQGDQQNPVNSTEEQQGSHNVGYNYDKKSTYIYHPKYELKGPNRDERLDKKGHQIQHEQQIIDEYGAETAGCHSNQQADQKYPFNSTEDHVDRKIVQIDKIPPQTEQHALPMRDKQRTNTEIGPMFHQDDSQGSDKCQSQQIQHEQEIIDEYSAETAGCHSDQKGDKKYPMNSTEDHVERKGQQIQHDKQIIAGQGQTSHQQSVDEHGGKIAGCHGDHQGDQQNPVNSTEEQQGSHNVGYNYDKNSTDIHHAKHELKVPNRDERLDRKGHQIQHEEQILDEYRAEIAGCHSNQQADQKYPINSTEDHVDRKGQQIQHDKQIIAGQGQTSHQQSVDEHGGEFAGCHGDHQGDQQNRVNSTEEQQGSHNVGYNYDKKSTDIYHAKHELKGPIRDERLDRKGHQIQHEQQIIDEYGAETAGCHSNQQADQKYPINSTEDHVERKGHQIQHEQQIIDEYGAETAGYHSNQQADQKYPINSTEDHVDRKIVQMDTIPPQTEKHFLPMTDKQRTNAELGPMFHQDDGQGSDKCQCHQIQHYQQSIAGQGQITVGQGQTSHQQFIDDYGAETACCHSDHKGDQKYQMNSTEDHVDRKEDRQIILTGYNCEFIKKAYDLFTEDLKVLHSSSVTFIKAGLYYTDDFDHSVPENCEKCIIIAPSTTSMDFLSDQDGQFTPLYQKAKERKLDTMLLCMAMPSEGSPASWKKMFQFVFKSSHQDSKNTIDDRRLYHKALDELSKTQPLLKELADRNKLISLSTDEHLNKGQIRAVKSFIGFNCSE